MLKNFFKKSQKGNNGIKLEKENFFENIEFDKSNFRDVFSVFLGKMIIVQNNCAEMVVKG